MFTVERRVILYPKINPQINKIRISNEDIKNLHFFEGNKKEIFIDQNL